jgi:hypothetical protein
MKRPTDVPQLGIDFVFVSSSDDGP